MPQNSRYCNVIPQKLCEYELNRGDPAETAVAVVWNGAAASAPFAKPPSFSRASCLWPARVSA